MPQKMWNKSKDIVIFGTEENARLACYYFTYDSPYTVVAFTVDREYLSSEPVMGRVVYPFEEIEQRFPPTRYRMFVALGYGDLNGLRATKYAEAKEKGYELVSYISSRASVWPDLTFGDNCLILEDNVIQPFVKIGNNNILWCGNHVGHSARIGNHCYISSHVVISGFTRIGDYSFLGVNATLRDNITIGEKNIIGAGFTILKDTQDKEVYAMNKYADPLELNSDHFMRMKRTKDNA